MFILQVDLERILSMNDLMVAYTGRKAKLYEAVRAKSGRWRRETKIMEALLKEIQPTTVLDCPYGTGRWSPQYNRFCKSQVIGIDISKDMLDQARRKLKIMKNDLNVVYDLRVGNIFDLEHANLGTNPDLVICVRFINWIDLKSVRLAIKRISYLNSANFILGASVVPINVGVLKRWWFKKALDKINRQSTDGRTQFVHDEACLLEIINENGWNLVEKYFVMRRSSRVNYFYHLVRA